MVAPNLSGTGNSPLSWRPTPTPISLVAGQNVSAGDWFQVDLSYRSTNGSLPVLIGNTSSGCFLPHVLYSPHADDSTSMTAPGRIQPNMYGGTATKRRSVYRIDTGVPFQVPWDGQLQIVAGDYSSASCILDVIVRRGFAPRTEAYVDVGGGELRPAMLGQWSPPVVGTPTLVPSTYLTIPANVRIPFSDGVAAIEVCDNALLVPAPVVITVHTMGQTFRVPCPSGQHVTISGMTQGGASTDGVPAMWSCSNTLDKAVIWSRLGC